MLEIKKLSPNDGIDIYEMLLEIPEEENGFINRVNRKSYDEYKVWLNNCYNDSQLKELVDGWKVPSTVYWLYADNRPIGIGKIRHFLTDSLRIAGGSIGYSIRPTERRRGYGKVFLGLLIDEAKKLGLNEILITVHEYNIASLKVVLANGGRLIKTEKGRHYLSVPIP